MASPKVVRVDETAYKAALQRGEQQAASPSAATEARYDAVSDAIVIGFTSGVVLSVPRQRIPEIAHVAPTELQSADVSPLGDALQIAAHDIDIYIPGLLARAFGEDVFASLLARKGGATKTAAKAAAARKNGAKGGRPPRATAASRGW